MAEECVLIIENSMQQHGKTIFLCLLWTNFLRDWPTTHIFAIWMSTQDSFRCQYIWKTKRKLISHVQTEHKRTEECLLVSATHYLPSREWWCQSSRISLNCIHGRFLCLQHVLWLMFNQFVQNFAKIRRSELSVELGEVSFYGIIRVGLC
jgi:hypothetical protein